MHLDIRTIIFITAVIQVLYAVGILLVNFAWVKSPALWMVSVSFSCGACGAFLMAYRDMIHPGLSIVVANVFVMANPVFALEAVIRFRKIKTRARLIGIILIILVGPVLFYATFVVPSLSFRIIVMSTFFGTQTLICALLLVRGIDRKFFAPASVTATVFAFATIVMALRIVLTMSQPDGLSFMAEGIGQSLLQLSYIIYITGITFGFIWLNTRELGLGISTALRRAEGGLHEQFDFIDVISHELKTPLATIQNSTESLVIRIKKLDSAQKKAFERIHRSLKRLDNIIEIGLKQKRLNPLQIQHQLVPAAITDIIQTAVEVCKIGFPEHKVIIHHDRSFAGKDILADPNSLFMAFSNILENAMKFSTAQDDIQVVLGTIKGMVTISVTDAGCGIDENLKEKVFEKYFRGANVDQVPGDGIGLFIVQHIIKAHHGTLAIQNCQSGGCRVDVSLPIFYGQETRGKSICQQ